MKAFKFNIVSNVKYSIPFWVVQKWLHTYHQERPQQDEVELPHQEEKEQLQMECVAENLAQETLEMKVPGVQKQVKALTMGHAGKWILYQHIKIWE